MNNLFRIKRLTYPFVRFLKICPLFARTYAMPYPVSICQTRGMAFIFSHSPLVYVRAAMDSHLALTDI